MSNPTLTAEQAFNVLAQASSEFKGTRRDHEMIELAIKTLEPLVPKDKDAAKAE